MTPINIAQSHCVVPHRTRLYFGSDFVVPSLRLGRTVRWFKRTIRTKCTRCAHHNNQCAKVPYVRVLAMVIIFICSSFYIVHCIFVYVHVIAVRRAGRIRLTANDVALYIHIYMVRAIWCGRWLFLFVNVWLAARRQRQVDEVKCANEWHAQWVCCVFGGDCYYTLGVCIGTPYNC